MVLGRRPKTWTFDWGFSEDEENLSHTSPAAVSMSLTRLQVVTGTRSFTWLDIHAFKKCNLNLPSLSFLLRPRHVRGGEGAVIVLRADLLKERRCEEPKSVS